MSDTSASLANPGDSTIMLRVLRVLAERPGLTRAELARLLGVPRSQLRAAIRALDADGLLEHRSRSDTAGQGEIGRPPAQMHLAGSLSTSVGLRISSSELQCGAFDASGRLLAEARLPMTGNEGVEQTLEHAEELVQAVLAPVARTAALSGIGVAVAASIDGAGNVVEGMRPTAWTGVDFVRELSARTGLPVSVENEANAAGVAEHRFGAGRGCEDLLYLHLSSGIRVALIAGHRLHRGNDGIAGAIGHTRAGVEGALCACGRRGCLETVAGPDVLREALAAGRRDIAAQDWTELAGKDADARRLVADAGQAIGAALATVIRIFDPARVVVGGQLAEAGGALLAGIEHGAGGCVKPGPRRGRVVRGTVGRRAAILGAASTHVSRQLHERHAAQVTSGNVVTTSGESLREPVHTLATTRRIRRAVQQRR